MSEPQTGRTLSELYDWCKEERDRNLETIKQIDEGRLHTSFMPEGSSEPVDTTAQYRADCVRSVESMERIMRSYERDHAGG